MSSFLEKLKKGMGVEVQPIEKKEESSGLALSQKAENKKEKMPKIKEEKKLASAETLCGMRSVKGVDTGKPASAPAPAPAVATAGKGGSRVPPMGEKIEVKTGPAQQNFSLENLNRQGGELAVDLYQNEEEFVIRSAVAGVKPEKLDILIEQDIITISGNREEPEEKEKCEYFSRECYFGPFSRKIISPVEIDPSRAKAIIKEGILFIRIPRIHKEKKIKLEVGKD